MFDDGPATPQVQLRAIDVTVDEGQGEMVVVGGNGSLYQRIGEERWLEIPSPVDATLFDVTVGDRDVAVGKDATVIERPSSLRNPRDSPDGDAYDGRGENYDEPTDQAQSGHAEASSETDSDDDTEAGADGNGDAEGSGETRLENGEVLVLLASRLDSSALSSASGYNIDDVEAALVELAEDADVDTVRVQAALDEERGN